jgi:hypothetical protein
MVACTASMNMLGSYDRMATVWGACKLRCKLRLGEFGQPILRKDTKYYLVPSPHPRLVLFPLSPLPLSYLSENRATPTLCQTEFLLPCVSNPRVMNRQRTRRDHRAWPVERETIEAMGEGPDYTV